MQEEEPEIIIPQVHLHGQLNDWFDPVYIQMRVELLKRHNKIESEDGSVRGDHS
jgi:hypothetical protein